MEKITIYSDGGARGNPGPAGIGVLIICDGKEIEISKYIGEKTNNQAEYFAIIEALNWVKENCKKEKEIDCYLDSELVVEQLNGRYKIKNEGLKPLFCRVRELILKSGLKISFSHVRREKNKKADRLVNLAIDQHLK